MERKKSWLRRDLDALRLQWDVLNFYERFEQLVAHVLSVVISIIVLVSLWQLIRAVISLLVSNALNPLDHVVFQTIFGMVMTLLIAMEFKHSITRVMARRDHIVQVKTVLLVALLAIARKFIILDPASALAHIAALAFALVALGSRDGCHASGARTHGGHAATQRDTARRRRAARHLTDSPRSPRNGSFDGCHA